MAKPVLLIRASGNEADASALNALGVDAVADPFLSIVAAPDVAEGQNLLAQLSAAPAPVWLIATSVNSIEKWGELVGPEILRRTITRRSDLRFAAIGERTSEVLTRFGAKRVVSSPTADSAGLARLLTQLTPATAVLPSGSLAMRTLPDALRTSGWAVFSGVVYETKTVDARPSSADRVDGGDFAAVVLRSPSAATALAELTAAASLATPVFAAGKTTASTAKHLGLNLVATSPSPTSISLAETVKKWLDEKGDEHD